MKHLSHPDKLYIQIVDECSEELGIAFCDAEPTDKNNLDFNDFDDETRQRVLHLLKMAYNFVYAHRYYKR